MRFSNIEEFCLWAKSSKRPSNREGILTCHVKPGSVCIRATRPKDTKYTLILHNFIAIPRGQGITSSVLDLVEYYLPEMHIVVDNIINERFDKYLVSKRNYTPQPHGRAVLMARRGAINKQPQLTGK